MRREKITEFSTYRYLRMGRESKSFRRRQKTNEGRLHLWIGGMTNDRPYRKVLREKYLKALEVELHALASQPAYATLCQSRLADLFRDEVERKVYDRLARHAREWEDLERSFEKTHGRPMTAQEAERYAEAVLEKDSSPIRNDPHHRSEQARRQWLHRIVDNIQHRSKNKPQKLQSAWAEAVGTEAAMQSSLTHVNRERGIAYAQSLSSALTHQITRNPAICRKLSQALHCPIQRIVFR